MIDYKDIENTDFTKKRKQQLIIEDLKLFSDGMGEDLFCHFMRGFVALGKLQSNQNLYIINSNHNNDPIASARNNVHLFFRIISDIYEWKDAIGSINTYLQKKENKLKYKQICESFQLKDLNLLRKEIVNCRTYNLIRNQIGSHDGNIQLFKKAISIVKNDKFIFGECLSDPNDDDNISSNSIIYNPSNLILKSLNIDENEMKNTMDHTLKITGCGIDRFQELFGIICTHVGILHLIPRQIVG